ncbi:MAG: hypothetical protein Kow0063_04860 [Anaerolineae bacterium]
MREVLAFSVKLYLKTGRRTSAIRLLSPPDRLAKVRIVHYRQLSDMAYWTKPNAFQIRELPRV